MVIVRVLLAFLGGRGGIIKQVSVLAPSIRPSPRGRAGKNCFNRLSRGARVARYQWVAWVVVYRPGVREEVMAGKPCLDPVGIPQHIVQCARSSMCFVTEKDYAAYLAFLAEISQKLDCNVHAYVLMRNRVHLLVTPMTGHGVSCMMQALGRCYLRYLNGRQNCTGALWEGRYEASTVDKERHVLARYFEIECNPMRAGMVRAPGDYRWTSYHFNGCGVADNVVVPHGEYLKLGVAALERQSAYRWLFGVAQGRARRRRLTPEPATPTPAISSAPRSNPGRT